MSADNIRACRWDSETKIALQTIVAWEEIITPHVSCRFVENIEDMFYNEILAAVVESTTLHIILSIAAVINLELHQINVKPSFCTVTQKKYVQGAAGGSYWLIRSVSRL